MARGEPPRKRLAKDLYRYICKQCGLAKNKTTGHTQLKGSGIVQPQASLLHSGGRMYWEVFDFFFIKSIQ